MDPPGTQSADSGRGGLAGRVGRGAECVGDVVVGKVVGVAEHDGRALGRRQAVGEVLDLGVGGAAVLDGQLGQLVADRLRAPARVDQSRAAIVSTQARRCSPCSSRS